MSPTARPAVVRFYLDADVLGLAKVLAELRPDLTYPGDPGGTVHKRERPPCPITNVKTDDDVWIPLVARHGWLIVTRDSKIQNRTAEIGAVVAHGARMVALASAEAKNVWSQLEVFMSQWRRIEASLEESGPFIYSATRTAFTSVELT